MLIIHETLVLIQAKEKRNLNINKGDEIEAELSGGTPSMEGFRRELYFVIAGKCELKYGGMALRKCIEYIGVLVIFIVLLIASNGLNQYMRALTDSTFNYALNIPVQVISSFIFGVFIGSLHFINEYKKVGSWKVNKERLLVLGLPLFITLVIVNSHYLGITWPQLIVSFSFFLLVGNGIKYVAVFLGYVVISSFTKKYSKSIAIVEEEIEAKENQTTPQSL
ncbi:MAG TPA: hypothetical protein GX523_00505 [Desulfitobacterium dehalogenans]|uniref:Uncharacterized protein n=1 Tax=Desulfitobacterium dehalogenans TaxID=36854 RepID=A0A7C6Z1Z2_9FIRM|nr:hypothetical protein [Desulfitobacterium dehalogenans]